MAAQPSRLPCGSEPEFVFPRGSAARHRALEDVPVARAAGPERERRGARSSWGMGSSSGANPRYEANWSGLINLGQMPKRRVMQPHDLQHHAARGRSRPPTASEHGAVYLSRSASGTDSALTALATLTLPDRAVSAVLRLDGAIVAEQGGRGGPRGPDECHRHRAEQ